MASVAESTGVAAGVDHHYCRWNLEEVTASDQAAMDCLAGLHMDLLHFGPMAQLGRGFIREICYRIHLEEGLLRAAVYRVDGQPAGFVAYTARSITFHRKSLRSHGVRAAAAVLKALVESPRRLGALAGVLGTLASRRCEVETESDPLGEVVCIGVRPEFSAPAFVRRSGINASRQLVDYAAACLQAEGVDRMRMIVDADNKPALLFYHHLGARFTRGTQAGKPVVFVWFDLTESRGFSRSRPLESDG